MSALEVAVERFFRSPLPDKLSPPHLKDRINVQSLRAASQRLGLTVTVRTLLPLLISEDLVPTYVFQSCSEAISQRQNVTHSGRREVTGASGYIHWIRELCQLLHTMTETAIEEDMDDPY